MKSWCVSVAAEGLQAGVQASPHEWEASFCLVAVYTRFCLFDQHDIFRFKLMEFEVRNRYVT